LAEDPRGSSAPGFEPGAFGQEELSRGMASSQVMKVVASTFSSVMYSSDGTTAGTIPLLDGDVIGNLSLVYKDEL
jgi:hypothetical protein